MKVAPIIHTRTFYCDFNSEFLVRPENFMDSDIKWARKNVLGATGEIDSLQGVRWLIVDNEKYRMAGVIGFLKDIFLRCHLSEEEKLNSERLFCDNKGRLVYAFIGIVIDKHFNDEYGSLTIDYLWKIYLEKICPIWDRKYQEVVLEEFTNINMELLANKITREPVVVGSKLFYEANLAMDYELFLELMCNKDKKEFSFCSNILDFNLVKKSEFSIITTSQNIITRILRENSIVQNKTKEEALAREKTSINKSELPNIVECKKKIIVASKIGWMILITIIIILLLIIKMGSN